MKAADCRRKTHVTNSLHIEMLSRVNVWLVLNPLHAFRLNNFTHIFVQLILCQGSVTWLITTTYLLLCLSFFRNKYLLRSECNYMYFFVSPVMEVWKGETDI